MPRPTPAPTISVVVPTHNRAERAVRLIDALAAQEGEPFEILVVDDASSDETEARLSAAAATHQNLVVIRQPTNAGPAAARNAGWRAARGEYIAFIDDDCVPEPDWLGRLTAPLAGDAVDIVVGRTRPPADQLHRIGPFSSYLDLGHDYSFSTCNIAYRKTMLEHVDGFKQDRYAHLNAEDTDLGLRAVAAGARDVFEPGAVVWHDVSASDFFTHFKRIDRFAGLVALVADHPEARRRPLGAGLFMRSVDKAVLTGWAALVALALRPRARWARVAAMVALFLYIWQFDRSHYRARSLREWLTVIPLGFVADSKAVALMIRSSLRYRTLLL